MVRHVLTDEYVQLVSTCDPSDTKIVQRVTLNLPIYLSKRFQLLRSNTPSVDDAHASNFPL
jgi:hypothetical protein